MSHPKIMIVPVTGFQQNCSIIWDESSRRGAVCDPGGDVAQIRAALKSADVTVEKIILTHGHIDHAGGTEELKAALGVSIEGPHLADKYLLDKLDQTGAQYDQLDARPCKPDRWLKDGDTVEFAGLSFAIFHCPGHSPGSVVFFNAAHRFCLMGDVLFNGSVGRTDLPGGDHATLIASIKEKLLPLGDDVTFLPGHGKPSSLGAERASNPFLL